MVVLLAVTVMSCAVGVRRDLSKTPPNEVIFEDQCHLQDYFDDLARGQESPPVLLASDEIQTSDTENTLGGRSTYRFGENTSLKSLRRLLGENWKPLPDEIMKATELDVEVRWCEKVGTRWVVHDDHVELRGGGKVVALAPHPCLTSFLFGKALYERRRELLGLPVIASHVEASRDAGYSLY